MNRVLIAGILALGVVVVPAAVAQETGPAITRALEVGNVSVRTLAKGLKFDATFKNQISSQKDKIGDTITGVIVGEVKDATGTVIFPAKSVANVEIMDIKGTDKDHTDGALVLVVRSVNVGNQTFRMKSAKDSLSAPADAKKIVSPVVVTGVVGRPKGAVVGANLVVTSGTAVTFELAEAVTVTS